MEQLELTYPKAPRARSTDPATSHAAARSVGDLRASQQLVLEVFRTFGPLSDEGLLMAYRTGERPRQSDSGLRTRRHELVEAGLLVDTGKRGRTEAGRKTIVWGLPSTKQAAAVQNTSEGAEDVSGRLAALTTTTPGTA